MAKYVKLDDVMWIINCFGTWDMCRTVTTLPTVELTLCEDCQYCDTENMICNMFGLPTNPKDFCNTGVQSELTQ